MPLPKGPRRPPAAAPARQLVVFLHGYGSDGDDLIDLAPHFARALPHAAFAAPHAPAACEMGFGYQWFGLSEPGAVMPVLNPLRMDTGAAEARPILDQWLDALLEDTGVSPENLVLVGFSQGTMMALETGLRRSVPPVAIIGFSGALTGVGRLATEITSKPPVLLVHGLMDPVVPAVAMQMAASVLTGLGVPVETVTRPSLAHGIDPEGLAAAMQFLTDRLPSAA